MNKREFRTTGLSQGREVAVHLKNCRIGIEGALVPGTRKVQPAVLKLPAEMEIPIIEVTLK